MCWARVARRDRYRDRVAKREQGPSDPRHRHSACPDCVVLQWSSQAAVGRGRRIRDLGFQDHPLARRVVRSLVARTMCGAVGGGRTNCPPVPRCQEQGSERGVNGQCVASQEGGRQDAAESGPDR